MRKNTLSQRLNIIKGQVDGLSKIIESKDSCKKITEQFHAINSGLKRVVELYFHDNLETCLKSMNSKNRETIELLVGELIKNK
ncbi:MAG: metal-sensing transcriptional repressor [Candidatus Gracilibacteria bacterium]